MADAIAGDRCSFVEGVQVREATDSAPAALIGYAAVFNQEAIINGPNGMRWRERIDPAAFKDAIGRDDVIAAVNHDSKQVLGRSRTGTLLLSADDHGLRYEVQLGRTTLAADTLESVRRGDYSGSSFKFLMANDGMRVAEKPTAANPLPLIVVERVQLIDVGPVTFPAYAGTSVSVRSVPDLVTECYRAEDDHAQQEAAAKAIADAAKTPAVLAREAARARLESAKAWRT